MELKDTACLITGGTRGIGAATAIALAERGGNVVLCARRIDDEANQVQKKIESLGSKCIVLAADL
ncbi:MAG TPA: SDR family NAD(P)-dependent oxidoreductase, partial [Tepidisphaeraceae bacterium]|nr:SDR family NAD(P)-dependent oxidoreductase [Tepidisphaeraceae bacterium]